MGKDKWDIAHLYQVRTSGGITCAVIGAANTLKGFSMCALTVPALYR